jgi:hypothetical protein
MTVMYERLIETLGVVGDTVYAFDWYCLTYGNNSSLIVAPSREVAIARWKQSKAGRDAACDVVTCFTIGPSEDSMRPWELEWNAGDAVIFQNP